MGSSVYLPSCAEHFETQLRIAVAFAACLLVGLHAPGASATPTVFPGAVGFGVESVAGRGGQILKVTNLNDSGPGSLRAAVAASGPRTVIFEVSGDIRLESQLYLNEPYITIAGQTAPSPGITLMGGWTFHIGAHDVLIQHLRFRPGADGDPLTSAISIFPEGAYNVVIDHCSASWSTDENTNTWGPVGVNIKDVTFSNNIISEGLDDSTHPLGPHSKGMLVGDGTERIAVIHNLFAHNADRNAEFKGGVKGVIANNVIYNWDALQEASYMSWEEYLPGYPTHMSVVANAYIPGPDTVSGSAYAVEVSSLAPPDSLLYIAGNLVPSGVSLYTNRASFDPIVTTPPISIPGFEPMSPDQLEPHAILNAGARPADRDPVDARIIQELISRTGGIIDDPSEVGGYPELAENHRSLTPPADPTGDDDGDGYTNLEEWIDDFSQAVTVPEPASLVALLAGLVALAALRAVR